MLGATTALVVLALAIAAPRAAPAREPLLDVIVTLRAQAPGGSGGAAVERSLRRTAVRTQRDLLRAAAARGARLRVVRSLWIVNAIELRATRADVDRLARDRRVASIRANAVLRRAPRAAASAAPTAPPADNVAQIGAPLLWQQGITGAGVTVASIDGGVDASHPALAANFRGGAGSWFDATGEHPDSPIDTSGHGTATLGVIVGDGSGGTAIGVAPDAHWIAARIFDDRGRATVAGIHAALQWALDPDGRPATADAPQVLNASWDRSGGVCDLEFEPDLVRLRAAHIVPVFASGNDGRDASPANNPSALAVGSVDADGAIASGSGRGPSTCGGRPYPALVAPGVEIPTSDVAGLYTTQTGTSMAAPHVSGALALLVGRFPHISALRQQSALQATAADLGLAGADDVFGYGRVNVAAAERWLLTARDLRLKPSTWTPAVRPGHATSLRVSVVAINGFSGPVTMTISGLPRGVRVAAVRVTLRGTRLIRLTVRAGARVVAGIRPVALTARAAGMSRTITLSLDVRR